MPSTFTLARERDGDVEVLTLNRPAALNAISGAMLMELVQYFGALCDADKGIAPAPSQPPPRVVVLKGAGRAFCAGLDLAGAGSDGSGTQAFYRGQTRFSELVLRMRRCPQPIIAVTQGATCGGGLALALASDVRIATPDLKCADFAQQSALLTRAHA